MEPYRKPFLIKSYNVLVGLIGGKQPLNASRLISDAKRSTGLKSLGDDFAQEALHRLVDAVNREANLHPFGRYMIREKFKTQLENRLWAQHWFEKYPEILEKDVLPVLVITGLQRTGTTKLQRLSSRQAGARALRSWEALYPSPLGNPKEERKRHRMTRRNERAVRYISPVFHAIHPIHTDQPEEDVLLMDLNFLSTSAEAIMHVPSFAEWLNEQDPRAAYEDESRLLKLLQWQKSGKYWILKSPHHLEFMQAMAEVLPVHGFVWTHRALKECIPSFMSMVYYSRAMFSDEVNVTNIIDHWVPKMGNMIKNGLHYRSQYPDKVCDVNFYELMNDAGNELKKVAGRFPGTLPMQPSIPRESYTSKHQYRKSDWPISAALWETAFSDYDKYYEQKR
jgi:hypothetical protein